MNRLLAVVLGLAMLICAGGCSGGGAATGVYEPRSRPAWDPMVWSNQREADRSAREARELDRRVERLEREGRAVTRP